MMDSYITSGILEPLNQYTDEWDEWGNFTKEYVDMFTKDGKVYGVPNQVARCSLDITKHYLKKPESKNLQNMG